MALQTLPISLEMERILNTRQAANLYGISVSTWRRLYWSGKTPPAIHLSDRRLGWRARDLLAHLNKAQH